MSGRIHAHERRRSRLRRPGHGANATGTCIWPDGWGYRYTQLHLAGWARLTRSAVASGHTAGATATRSCIWAGGRPRQGAAFPLVEVQSSSGRKMPEAVQASQMARAETRSPRGILSQAGKRHITSYMATARPRAGTGAASVTRRNVQRRRRPSAWGLAGASTLGRWARSAIGESRISGRATEPHS
jgi:hypothetical protein